MAKKRINGQGTIYRDNTRDRWIGEVHITDPLTGKRTRRRCSAKTAKEARAKLATIIAENPAELDHVPLDTFLNWYTTTHLDQRVNAGEITPATRSTMIRRLEHATKHLPPSIMLDQIDAPRIEHIKYAIDAEGIARSTQVRILRELSLALNVAVYHGFTKVNRAAHVKKLPVPFTPKSILSPTECQALLADVQGHWLEPWYILALPSGMRVMEASGVTWDAINLETKTIHLDRQLHRSTGQWSLQRLKSRREGEYRTIPLATFQIDFLTDWKTRQTALKAGYGDAWGNPFNLVATTLAGKPVYSRYVQDDIKERAVRLGFTCGANITPHTLRRSAVSTLLANGVDIGTAMKIMGWTDARVPLEIYAQLTEQGIEKATNVFETAYGTDQKYPPTSGG